MELSPKAIRFLIDALKLYEEHVECRLQKEECLSDNELADLANDRQYLLALRQELHSRHEDLLKASEAVPIRPR